MIFSFLNPYSCHHEISGGKSLEYFTIIANKVLVNALWGHGK